MKVLRYVLTYFRTSSSLERLNNLRIFEALLGPLILGFSTSVNPGRSLSPFFTITKFKTERSGLTMHPRTDFLLLSPFLLPYPRKQGVPDQTKFQLLTTHHMKCRTPRHWQKYTSLSAAKDEHGPGLTLLASLGNPACHSLP